MFSRGRTVPKRRPGSRSQSRRCPLQSLNLFKLRNGYAAAEVEYRIAIELQPDFAEAYFSLGGLLQEAVSLAEAESAPRKLVTLKPYYVDAHYNLSKLLKETRHLTEAETEYRHALAIEPQHADAQWNLGLLLLLLGRCEEGWPFYEARYSENRTDSVVRIHKVSCPQWQCESLSDKSLLIWPEQGSDDYIQLSRFAEITQGAWRFAPDDSLPLRPGLCLKPRIQSLLHQKAFLTTTLGLSR